MHKHDYSSTQLDLPRQIADRLLAIGRDIPTAELGEDGRETDPHITVKYGLHTNKAADVREVLRDQAPVTLRFGKTSLFEASEGKNYDVIKIDIESEALHRLNKLVGKSLKVTDTFPTYKPHATIAYVKAGKGMKYVGKNPLTGKEVTIDTVYFSDKDGNKHPISLNGDHIENEIRAAIAK